MMPRRITVLELQDILERHRQGQSIKGIRRELGRHKTVIRKVKRIAAEHGWLDPQKPLPTERDLIDAYEGSDGDTDGESHALDRFKEDIRRWIKDDYSFVVMHKLVSERVFCSESTVRRYVHKNFPKSPKAVMVRQTIAGDVMEVDFGYLGISWDRNTRRRRKTWFFSARLRHSRRAYREVVFDQKQNTFFFCHIHAFEWFGGVPRKVTPDNLKAAIIKASFEDPLVNRAYRSLAEYYGFLISPCLPGRPAHKGGVESDVKYVKRNFFPLFKEHQRQRGKEILDSEEMAEELDKWNLEVADVRIIQKVGRSPLEIFEEEERVALNPLAAKRWDPVTFKEPSVGTDWRVQFEKAFYSVPYAFIGRTVLVMSNSKIVRIFCDYVEITCHERAMRPWEYKWKAAHAPPNVEKYLNASTQGLRMWAGRLGPSVEAVVRRILDDKVVDGIRPVRGLLRFSQKYSPERLEAACKRALAYETPTYMSVKRILKNELDRLPMEQPAELSGQLQFRFKRPIGYFDTFRADKTLN
jgi:transposase